MGNCKCKCDCKRSVLLDMVRSLDARLKEAQESASKGYALSWSSADWIRSAAHDRANAIIKEYKKIREML